MLILKNDIALLRRGAGGGVPPGQPDHVRVLLDRLGRIGVGAGLSGAAGVLGWQLLSARLYTVTLHTRGLELTAGLIPRRGPWSGSPTSPPTPSTSATAPGPTSPGQRHSS